MDSDGAADLLEADLTRSVIGSFYEVHRELGFGFREYIYALALELERLLTAQGSRVQREVSQRAATRACL